MKKALNWLGTLLAVASVIYIVLRLKQYGADLDLSRFTLKTWLITSLLVLLYTAACYLLPLAWRLLLQSLGENPGKAQAIALYGKSQLAKYVPGNVMQFFGRQALGLADGLGGWALAKSALWEIGLLVLAALPFLALLAPFVLNQPGAPMALGALLGLLLYVGIRWLARLGPQRGAAFTRYCCLLAVFGIIFATCFITLSETAQFEPMIVVYLGCAYVGAWLVGMVTPGASAGIGVREVVLLALLSGVSDEPTLLLAALLARIVTTLGDFAFFGLAFLVRPAQNPAAD